MSTNIVSSKVDDYLLQDILSSVYEAAVRCNSVIPNVIICNIGSYLPIHLNIMLFAKLNSKETKNLFGLKNFEGGRCKSVFDHIWSNGFPQFLWQKYGIMEINPMRFEIHNEKVFVYIGFCVEKIAELGVYGIVLYMNITSNFSKIKVCETPILVLNAKKVDLHEYVDVPRNIMNGKHNITYKNYNIAMDTMKWHLCYRPVDKNSTYLDDLFRLRNFDKLLQLAKENDYEMRVKIQLNAKT